MATPCPTTDKATDGEVSPLTEPSCGGVSAAEVSMSPGAGGKENNPIEDDAGLNDFNSGGDPANVTATTTTSSTIRHSSRIKARREDAKKVEGDEDDVEVEEGTGGTKRSLQDRTSSRRKKTKKTDTSREDGGFPSEDVPGQEGSDEDEDEVQVEETDEESEDEEEDEDDDDDECTECVAWEEECVKLNATVKSLKKELRASKKSGGRKSDGDRVDDMKGRLDDAKDDITVLKKDKVDLKKDLFEEGNYRIEEGHESTREGSEHRYEEGAVR